MPPNVLLSANSAKKNEFKFQKSCTTNTVKKCVKMLFELTFQKNQMNDNLPQCGHIFQCLIYTPI